MQAQFTSLLQPIAGFLKRYHFLIFFVATVSGLSVAMFFLNHAIESSDNPEGYTSKVNDITFDQQTISRLETLRGSDQSTSNLKTSGRINPF